MTNLEWSEEEVWKFYNYRGTEENSIKELKKGFFIDKIPTEDFYANYADLLLKVIAYNLFIRFKRACLPQSWWRYTVTTLRRLIFLIAAVIRKHAREFILRLSSWWGHKDVFRYIFSKLANAPPVVV